MEQRAVVIHRKTTLLVIIAPITFQYLMSAMVSASDAIMLGMLEQDSLSAVSLATQVYFVLSLFLAAITIGTTILVAQYWGKKDGKSVEKILGLSIRYSMAISLMFFAASFFAPRFLMRIFTGNETLIAQGAVYLRIVSFSYLFSGASQIYLCIMKNCGQTIKSAVISSVTMGSNIALNAIFIFGLFGLPRYGIAGSATATVIAKGIELAWVAGESLRPGRIHIRMHHIWKADHVLNKDFVKYTYPVLGNELVWGCGFTMYSVIMGHLGTDAVAANSVANIVKNIVSCFCLGIGAGSGIIIGNELGAGNRERAINEGKRLLKLSIAAGAGSGVVLLLLMPIILGFGKMFTADALSDLKGMLIICSYYLIGKSINSTTISGIFCAGGDTKFGFLCDAVTEWGVIIPLGLIAAFVLKLPILVVYFILSMDEFVKLPAVYVHYKKYLWAKNIIR